MRSLFWWRYMARKDKNGLTPKREAYCQARAAGKSQRKAYKESHSDDKSSDKSIDENACRLETDIKVISRIEQIKARTAQGLQLTRDDIAAQLADIASDTDKSDSIRLKAYDQLARVIGAYEDRALVDVRAVVLSAEDKSRAIREYLTGMIDQ